MAITLKKQKKKGTRRKDYSKRRKQSLAMLWIRRSLIVGFVTGFVVWGGAWLWMSGTLQSSAENVKERFMSETADAGLRIENILVEGRVYSDPDLLRGLMNVDEGDPLFSVNPQGIKKQVMKITWVDDVQVYRRFPHTLYIKLIEKQPVAIWVYKDKKYIVDAGGAIITDQNLDQFSYLFTIHGASAPDRLQELVENITPHKDLIKRLKQAHWVGDRRWDVVLENNITIQLPAENAELAFSILMSHQKSDQILDKALQSIDLRDPHRMMVKVKPGQVQTIKTSTSSNI